MAATFRVPGPCTIQFGGVPLGVSKAGITIRCRTSWSPITDDEHGTEPADFIFTGKSAQVEVASLDVVALESANLFHAYGGLLASGGAAGMTATIGGLASALSAQLDIIERGGIYTWVALGAVPLDPDSILLASTSELQLPVTFLIVPDANEKLFSTIPAYII